MSQLIQQGQALVAAARETVETHHVRIDPAHQYWKGTPGFWQGPAAPVLGVTETLRRVGIIDDRWFAEEHAERGTRVHALARQAVERFPPWIWSNNSDEGYGCSLRAWLEEKQPTTVATELLVYHQGQDYAGTLDWIGVLDDALWVIDWKSSMDEARWHALQTAGYAEALVNGSRTRVRRGCVYLSGDGTIAKLRGHYRPTDKGYFFSALTVERFKQKVGV